VQPLVFDAGQFMERSGRSRIELLLGGFSRRASMEAAFRRNLIPISVDRLTLDRRLDRNVPPGQVRKIIDDRLSLRLDLLGAETMQLHDGRRGRDRRRRVVQRAGEVAILDQLLGQAGDRDLGALGSTRLDFVAALVFASRMPTICAMILLTSAGV
jgi:hypothetical protein